MVTAKAYETLVECAASLTDAELIGDIDDLDLSIASAILHRNQAALQSARNALGPQCVVPLRYDESFFCEHSAHFPALRNLARMLRVEAHLAGQNNDYQATAAIGLNILDLANAIRRGGLVTDLLVGIAVSGMAIETLRKSRTHFDSATRQLLMRDLRRMECEREPFAEILARDRVWEAAVGSDDEPCDFSKLSKPDDCELSEEEYRKILQLLQQMAGLPKTAQEKMYLDQDRQILAMMRMLVIDLALRDRYESFGCFAEHLSSLVPEVLPELPVDPFTDASFIYRRVGDTSFDLHSTGPKMHDGGGIIGPWPLVAAGSADLYLDAADHWPIATLIGNRTP